MQLCIGFDFDISWASFGEQTMIVEQGGFQSQPINGANRRVWNGGRICPGKRSLRDIDSSTVREAQRLLNCRL